MRHATGSPRGSGLSNLCARLERKTYVLWHGAVYPSVRSSVNNLVRSQKPIRISSCNFIGIFIRSGRRVAHKNGRSPLILIAKSCENLRNK